MDAPPVTAPLRWFANLLAGARFNCVTAVAAGDSRYWSKHRCRHAAVLVPLANWYARRTGMKIRVLTRAAWLRHEPLMYRLLLGCRVRSSTGTLWLPHLPGRCLRSLLEHNRQLTGENELAVALAVRELARLHTCRVPHPFQGELALFSHADATARNVLIDPERKRAHWIDFETTHDPGLPAPVRHADDLLTLLGGAAAALEPGQWPALCDVMFRSYQSWAVTDALLGPLHSWTERAFARRLAFPGFGDAQWHLLCRSALAAADRLRLRATAIPGLSRKSQVSPVNRGPDRRRGH